MTENQLVDEVVDAMGRGETHRARALLIRLITQVPTRADYWVWLSSVAESTADEITDLQQALRLDPNHAEARERLVQLGIQPPTLPPSASGFAPTDRSSSSRRSPRSSGGQRPYYAAVFWVAAVILVVAGVSFGLSRRKSSPLPLPGTAVPSSTYLPTNTLVVRSPTPTFVGPAPLWLLLQATYTPTPLYIQTPHPRSEAYQVGMQRYRQGDWEGLVDFMRQVLFLEPDAVDASYYAGEGWRLQGKYEQALEYYQQAIQINPSFAAGYLGRAQAQWAIDPEADVQADIDQSLALDPNLVDAYLFSAQVAVRHGDAAAAVAALTEAEKRVGVTPALLVLRAEAGLLTGQADLSLQDAREANRLDVTMIAAYRVLGLALQANELAADAVPPLQVYLRYVPADTATWLSLAGAQYAAGDTAGALASLETALAVDAKMAPAYLLRAEILLDSAVDTADPLEAALRASDDLIQATLYGADPFHLALAKGRVSLLVSMPDEALRNMNHASEFAATDDDDALAAVYYWRAQVYTVLKQPDLAAQDWQALLALPQDASPVGWREQAEVALSQP